MIVLRSLFCIHILYIYAVNINIIRILQNKNINGMAKLKRLVNNNIFMEIENNNQYYIVLYIDIIYIVLYSILHSILISSILELYKQSS